MRGVAWGAVGGAAAGGAVPCCHCPAAAGGGWPGCRNLRLLFTVDAAGTLATPQSE